MNNRLVSWTGKVVLAVILAGCSLWAQATPQTGALPEAPSAARSAQPAAQASEPVAPASAARPSVERKATADWSYLAVTGALYTSSIVNAEYATRCVAQTNNCTSIPDPFRSRGAMYAAGLPAATGVSYLTYYLKSHGHRWWFVPAAAITAGNAFVAAHWAHRIR